MTDTQPSQEPYVSTAPTTSAAGKVRSEKRAAKKKPDKARPWRDNLEAIAVSIVTIVLFKYFVVEAYKIPTGSMQPTLMGNAQMGIFDRVLVDKLSYHFRDPERFEIVVFKYPLESSKNFIKRIVGMPGEEMRLAGGDAFVRKIGETEWTILRRPRPIQNAQLRELETGGSWQPFGRARDHWTIDSTDERAKFIAKGSGRVKFPKPPGSIKNMYLDGYPAGMKAKLKQKGGSTDVSDLRIAFEAKADATTRAVTFTIHEGPRAFQFIIPGPAAPKDDVARIAIEGLGEDELPAGLAVEALATDGFRLPPGKSVDIEVQNLNDLLALRIDGAEVAILEVPPAPEIAGSSVELEVDAEDGSRTEVDDVRIWRDLYYISSKPQQKVTEWTIPNGHYVVLGDNSQDSSDGRDWELASFEVTEGPDKGQVVRGNSRAGGSDENPREVTPNGEETLVFFVDELGERRVYPKSHLSDLTSEPASLVPRELIRGRAVLVVWPLAPQHDIYRLKWVR